MLDNFDHPDKTKDSSPRWLWLAGAACGLCCALPLFGLTLGSVALATVAGYAEKLMLGAILLASAGFAIWRAFNRKRPACNMSGDCKCSDTQDPSRRRK